MDTPLDIQRQKYLEWKEARRMAMRDECENCLNHTPECPYYEQEEESWNWEECYENE